MILPGRIAIVSLVLIVIFIGVASAEVQTVITPDTLITSNPTPTPEPEARSPIMQGQCVAIGEYYDISGIGWNNGYISWYGRWYDNFAPDEDETKLAQLAIPSQISKLRNYYIDPEIFTTRKGYWYMDYNDYERAGNARLFWVNTTCPVQQERTIAEKVTETNQTYYPLPQKKETDLMIAKGDPVTLNITTPATYWLIGYDDALYDREATGGKLTISATDIRDFSEGDYMLNIITPGNNTIIEEHYDPETDSIVSPLRAVEPVSLDGIQPKMAGGLLRKQVEEYSDDSIVTWNVKISDPVISIARAEETANSQYLKVSGYTNVAIGTTLTFIVDPDTAPSRDYRNTTAKTIVISGGGHGYWNQFSVNVPFNLGDLMPGTHIVQATSPQGGYATISPYKRQETPDNYQPLEYLSYVDNDPLLPTPTPEIRNVPGPTRTVTIPVTITPSKDDWENYAKAQAEYEAEQESLRQKEAWDQAVPRVLTTVFIIGVAYFGYSLYRAKRRKP